MASGPMWILCLAIVAIWTCSSAQESASNSQSSASSDDDIAGKDRKVLDVLKTTSGLEPWVDINTPDDVKTYQTSRGETWHLVMSDEFTDTNRSFKPGEDHFITSLEKPDGVNGAVEIYSHNMTSIQCDEEDGEEMCYLQIKTIDEVTVLSVYNLYTRPPSYQNSTFYYRSGMLQSWNKFCFRGGMLEFRAKMPGAITEESGNPDIYLGSSGRALNIEYYPTWPGLWIMGNLGRAIFSASTYRMWPFTYDECNNKAFDSSNQRISACDSNPGHGLNPNQGRGAPEIDILEGGGTEISSSIQLGPGMPMKYRLKTPNKTYDGSDESCFYARTCKTPGANDPNVPTKLYKERDYQTWYAGMRYAPNPYCVLWGNWTQSWDVVKNTMKTGITENKCDLTNCPFSKDVLGDTGYIDGDKSKGRWGINSEGACYPVMNGYRGTYLCDPDSTDENCPEPRNSSTPKTDTMEPFNYRMDALSANWDAHMGVYMDFQNYQLEWVLGDEGYVRWQLNGVPIYEIPSETITNIGQDADETNPNKIPVEEPMYIIMNVAISQQWGAFPPNIGKRCRGDGKDEKANRICDSFPMYMKVDHIRLYQDNSGSMSLGCDPNSHPTRKWIQDHIDDYEDPDNLHIDVHGGATCKTNDDCSIPYTPSTMFQTGYCGDNGRCSCSTQYYGGPRCTTQLEEVDSTGLVQISSYGPPMSLSIAYASCAWIATIVVIIIYSIKRRKERLAKFEKEEKLRMRKEYDITPSSAKTPNGFDKFDEPRT